MTILDQFRLTNRTALVTGGNRGLGRAMAQALAEAGARVALSSRDRERAQVAAREIADAAGADGERVRGYACEISEAESVQALVDDVVRDLGGLDILINNAGINIRGAIDELAPDEFLQVQATNVTGPWLLTRAAAPHLKQSQAGRVIMLGSILSVIAMPERTPYATSKGAILQMTRALALEWAPLGITVNAILPGPFGTEMNQSLMDDPEKYKAFLSNIPMGRWGEVEEIGGLAVFLASDAASFITGAGLTIDGGWTAR